MAAYAALTNVMQIIQQLEHHPSPPISLDKKQLESLTKNITFFQELLENYSPYTPTEKYEEDGIESSFLDIAHGTENIIESRIVAHILDGSTSGADQVEFEKFLQEWIEVMDGIRNELMEKIEKMGVQRQLESSSSGEKENINSASSSTTTMVGLNDALLELLDKLTGGGLDRQIIPIVGMGGIGKTTLAINVYAHPLIKEHFDIHAWATISQEYDAGNILNEILSQSKQDRCGKSSEIDVKEIGTHLHKYLFGRRYLIVMDDMWSIEAWDKISFFFPDNNNGSRIVVTTRLSDLSRRLSNSYVRHMNFLDFDESWDLFSKSVFPRDGYPSDIIEIGKKIVEICRGLPLSIVVVGGFLAKSEYRREEWEQIEENFSLVVNNDNDEHCLKMLQMSYNQLPVHLKPCFLYMGLFKEDRKILISKLVKLWVAEGFLKPINGKDLEEVADEYLNDLVDRNLIFTVKGRGRCVKIHDLLRSFCWRQAEAERFYSVVTRHSVTIPDNQHRFVVSEAKLQDGVLNALLSTSHVRSITSFDTRIYPSPNHILLRIYGTPDDSMSCDYNVVEYKFQQVNLRYLVTLGYTYEPKLSTSLPLFWNLQTLIIQSNFRAPAEIWNMTQLRHVHVFSNLWLPDPPTGNGQDDIVLENLQTLMIVTNFRCSEEVVKRIPNIKKLGLLYESNELEDSYLSNIDRLGKLKSLYCSSSQYPKRDGSHFLHKLSYPRSLTKLTLQAIHIHWEDMLEKIGSLPLLQKLKLINGCFSMNVWETVEDQFPSLKFLEIFSCSGLEYWNSECSHFPRLEHLVLWGLKALNEIPLGIGEIPTLQSIELFHCNKSAVISCKRMQEEQEELYGEEEVTFRVTVKPIEGEYAELQYLANPNFQIFK